MGWVGPGAGLGVVTNKVPSAADNRNLVIALIPFQNSANSVMEMLRESSQR
jgi:hypothetical protein